MAARRRSRFVYDASVDVGNDDAAAAIASAIGEPARARMLYCLIDGRARTSTELAIVADVAPSTASVHLQRLKDARLVRMFPQGRHRYYRLERADVAAALEALSVAAGASPAGLRTRVPRELRLARTCYDHIAGTLGVALHDGFVSLGWLTRMSARTVEYDVTAAGASGLGKLGLDLEAARRQRRRFAFACVDWSERRPHLAGALGAAMLDLALQRRWVTRDPDGRALEVTVRGRRELHRLCGIELSSSAA